MAQDRIKKAKSVLQQLEKDKAKGTLSANDELEIKGRIFNIVMRGYDIPLQGSTTKTCEIKRVIPEPSFFNRKGFHKLF